MTAARREELPQSDIVWLTAMLEAEGTFTFQYNEQLKNGTLHSHIQPRVIFVNSDRRLVDRVEFLLNDLGFLGSRKDGMKSGMGAKLKSEVVRSGFKTRPLLELLRPHMVGEKTECVDCMIEFIKFRQHLQAIGTPKQKYSEVEFTLLRRVREINSGHWKQTPKFSMISTEAVGIRRDECARKLALVV